MEFETIRYETDGRVATITLDRPEAYNAIVEPMPAELRTAVEAAGDDQRIHAVVLRGAGPGFCGGYDLNVYAEGAAGEDGRTAADDPARPGGAGEPWDPMLDYQVMGRFTRDFMSIWRAPIPVVAAVHGAAVAGGSDIALTADLVVMAEDGRIGYPPARVWGCPTTMMWVHRLGIEQAKRMLFTGDVVDGAEAARIGLVHRAVPAGRLDGEVAALVERIATVPRNQLTMMKLAVNQAHEQQGLSTTQLLATVFDGIARHTPEGQAFRETARREGWRAAVRRRDAGDPPAGD